MLESLTFAFGIFQGVFDPNIVRPEEIVELKASFDSKQPLQFGLCETLVLILLGGQSLERAARQIATVSAQTARKIVRNLHGQVHCVSPY